MLRWKGGLLLALVSACAPAPPPPPKPLPASALAVAAANPSASAASTAPSAMPAVPPLVPRDAQLDWVGGWDGSPPEVFAAGDEFLLTFVGNARLGGRDMVPVAAAPKPSSLDARPLWFLTLTGDAQIKSATRAAGTFAWARGLARIENGDLLVDGARERSTHELLRFHADGSLVWSRPLPSDMQLGPHDIDSKSGRIALALIPGSREPNAEAGTFGHLARPNQPAIASVRLYDAAGALRFSVELSSEPSPIVAVDANDGLILGGMASQAPSAPFLPPGLVTQGSNWLAALDEHGRTRWARAIDAKEPQSLGALHGVAPGRALLARDLAPGASTLLDVLDAKTGQALASAAIPGHRQPLFGATSGEDLWFEFPSDTDGVRLSSLDRAGRERWHAELAAMDVNSVAVLPNHRWLVMARYPSLLFLPRLEPKAALVSGHDFAYCLASYSEVAPGSAQPPTRVLDRATEPVDATPPAPGATPTKATRGGLVAELRKSALRAYKAKRYAEACDSFAQAQMLAPASAANMGDLGLCKLRADRASDALLFSRYAVDLAHGDSSNASQVRHAAYYNLSHLDAQRGLSFSTQPCTTLTSDAYGCEKPVHVCGFNGTLGMDTRVAITSFTAARFALSREAADAGDFDSLSWPEFGDDPDQTFDLDGAASYDVSLEVDRDQRDGAYNTISEPVSRCDVIYADGCSGLLALACSWSDDSPRSKPTTKVVELRLTAP